MNSTHSENLTVKSMDAKNGKVTGTFCKLAILVPFFLAGALYLSVIFAIFSALPIIYAHLRFGRWAGILSSITNMAVVLFVSGRVNAAVFFVFAVVLALAISECVKLKLKVEWNVLFSVGVMFLVSAILLLSYSHKFNINPLQKLDTFVSMVVDQVANNVEKYKTSSSVNSQEIEKFLADPEMTKRNILFELPSAVMISYLIVVISNFLLMIRLNLNGVRERLNLSESFFRVWKAPDHLVWPTLAAGFCFIIEVPVLSEIALNAFKVFMMIYAIQGLAITCYLFDQWELKGFIRTIGYFISVALLLPLIISLGFFDLWFDFRDKFKIQINRSEE